MHLRSSSDFLFLFKDSSTVWVFNFTSFYFFNYFILLYFGWWIPWLPGLWTEVPCFSTTCGYPEALTTLAFWLSLIAYILPWNYLVHSHLKFLLGKAYWYHVLEAHATMWLWMVRQVIDRETAHAVSLFSYYVNWKYFVTHCPQYNYTYCLGFPDVPCVTFL